MLAQSVTLILMLASCAGAPAPSPESGKARDTVVLLHGIGHTRWNMMGVEKALRRAGFDTINISHPSLSKDIGALAGFVNERLEKEKLLDRPGRVHFVTHSLGGLVARRYLDQHRNDIPPEKMGRLVMLAPPNGGSEVADFMKNFPPYRWVFGPAGQELTTAARATDTTQPWYETGVIAGTTGWPYIVADRLIEGDHDGRVAVEKTKLPGMTDFTTVPATHSFISWRGDVHEQIVRFLRDGKFGNTTP